MTKQQFYPRESQENVLHSRMECETLLKNCCKYFTIESAEGYLCISDSEKGLLKDKAGDTLYFFIYGQQIPWKDQN